MIAYLEDLIGDLPEGCVEIITPRATAERGCQLSLRVRRNPKGMLAALAAEGVVCDFRAPDVIRVAPVPLYNTFHEIWRFARILHDVTGEGEATQ